MKVILNIHGFLSGPGDKLETLEREFPEYTILCPQLKDNPVEDIQTLLQICKEYEDSDIHIVGTSLGGFYTLCLSYILPFNKTKNIYYYAINPSFTPHITLSKYKGEKLKNYKTDINVEITEKNIEVLKKLHNSFVNNFTSNTLDTLNIYIGEEDDLLDFNDLLDFLKSFNKEYNVNYSKQDHRHKDISKVVENILENSLK